MRTIYEAKLLLIDDNPDLIQLLCEQLNHAGYTWIQTASNCEDARTAFSKQRPDCMILDINLPDGDGFSLFRELRAQADIPTLFLSARDADADRLFGLGLGADDYLTNETVFDARACPAHPASITAHLSGRIAQKYVRFDTNRLSKHLTVRCFDTAARRQHAVPYSNRTHHSAKAHRKSRPYRHIRCFM